MISLRLLENPDAITLQVASAGVLPTTPSDENAEASEPVDKYWCYIGIMEKKVETTIL